jgi:hypothetical protein
MLDNSRAAVTIARLAIACKQTLLGSEQYCTDLKRATCENFETEVSVLRFFPK